MGCVLAAGSVSGGMFERHHRQEAARIGAEWARIAQANLAFDAGSSALPDGERVHGRAEGIENNLADLRL